LISFRLRIPLIRILTDIAHIAFSDTDAASNSHARARDARPPRREIPIIRQEFSFAGELRIYVQPARARALAHAIFRFGMFSSFFSFSTSFSSLSVFLPSSYPFPRPHPSSPAPSSPPPFFTAECRFDRVPAPSGKIEEKKGEQKKKKKEKKKKKKRREE